MRPSTLRATVACLSLAILSLQVVYAATPVEGLQDKARKDLTALADALDKTRQAWQETPPPAVTGAYAEFVGADNLQDLHQRALADIAPQVAAIRTCDQALQDAQTAWEARTMKTDDYYERIASQVAAGVSAAWTAQMRLAEYRTQVIQCKVDCAHSDMTRE